MRSPRPDRLLALLLVAVAWIVPSLAGALTLSESARILAGLPVDPTALTAIDSARYARYAEQVDEWWVEFDTNIGQPSTTFARAEIPQTTATVFYPFAGADFTTIHRLYPDATRYVLIALQPAGPMPDLTASQRDTNEILDVFYAMMEDFHRRAYFITEELNDQFSRNRTAVPGITPVMAMAAEREGFEVVSVTPIGLNADGSDVLLLDPATATDTQWRSVRIALNRRADGVAVTLDYLRLDLSDDNLEAQPADRAFVEAMSHHPTFFKAASYLPQYTNFEVVAQSVLANAPSVVQDESGIDYAELAAVFEVRLYGEFEVPHEEFSASLQSSLREAYDVGPVLELPFRFGYWKNGLWCMQIAHRRR